jgi:transposase
MVEIQNAKRRFGLPEETPVISCYEAGRDGFWLHRYLEHQGIENLVVDSASIEVNRRQRRAKSDNLDATKLVGMLIRWHLGGRRSGAWFTCDGRRQAAVNCTAGDRAEAAPATTGSRDS